MLCLFVSVFSLCLPCPALCFDLSVFLVCIFFKVPVRGRVPYQPIAASRNSFESPSCAEYSAATVIAI